MPTDLKLELDQLSALGKRRVFYPSTRSTGAIIEVRGKKLVDFANWDSLGLSFDKKLKRTVQNYIEQHGFGTCAARLSSGTCTEHLIAEDRIAKFLGYETALLFSSKNQAVLSLVSALCNEQDLILHDDLIQNAVTDAAYLVNAKIAPFSLQDPASLERELDKGKACRQRLIFVESVSPITGNSPDFAWLLALAVKHAAQLVVDESFALGTIGLRGAGASEEIHMSGAVAGVICDLSLSVCSYGAFVGGGKLLCDYLISRSKTFTLEGALPPALAVFIHSAIDAIELRNAARQKVWGLSQKLRQGLLGIFGDIAIESKSCSVCQQFKKTSTALALAEALFQRGYFVEALATGAARSNAGALRFVITCEHTDLHIESLLNAVAEIAPRLER
jgi:8-amino-7-oxononanoate synthase